VAKDIPAVVNHDLLLSFIFYRHIRCTSKIKICNLHKYLSRKYLNVHHSLILFFMSVELKLGRSKVFLDNYIFRTQ